MNWGLTDPVGSGGASDDARAASSVVSVTAWSSPCCMRRARPADPAANGWTPVRLGATGPSGRRAADAINGGQLGTGPVGVVDHDGGKWAYAVSVDPAIAGRLGVDLRHRADDDHGHQSTDDQNGHDPAPLRRATERWRLRRELGIRKTIVPAVKH